MAARNFPNVSDLNQRELYRVTDDHASAILWARQHGLLATQMVCPNCPKTNEGKQGCKKTRWHQMEVS